ncbi:MAG: hypothetical protein WBG36_13535 [Ornithinimicrobium sp.]
MANSPDSRVDLDVAAHSEAAEVIGTAITNCPELSFKMSTETTTAGRRKAGSCPTGWPTSTS